MAGIRRRGARSVSRRLFSESAASSAIASVLTNKLARNRSSRAPGLGSFAAVGDATMKSLEASRAAGRLGLTIGGEAMQSGVHFALNIVLIHLLPARDYGVFAITMVIGGIGLTYISLADRHAGLHLYRTKPLQGGRQCFYEGTFGAAAIVWCRD